jgi:hypothetical protein
LCTVLCGGVASALACAESVYTSVAEGDCKAVAVLDAGRRIVSGRGDFAFECQAPQGLRLYLVTDDARSWYALEFRGRIHSLERAIAYDDPPGDFPNVGKGGKVEWRLRDGRPVGVIFRVSYQTADAEGSFSKLIAVDLRGDAPRVQGLVATNEAAHALIDRCAE